jgi:hypothetical protein
LGVDADDYRIEIHEDPSKWLRGLEEEEAWALLDVYLYIVVFPLVRGRGFLHICTHVDVLYMWHLAPEEY